MSYSDYLAAAMQNHFWRDTALAQFGTVYVSLHTGDPTRANNTATEVPAADGYARVAIATTNAAWSAPASSGGRMVVANVDTLTWPTATGDWAGGDPIAHFGIYDALTGGNLLRFGELGEVRSILLDDIFTAAPGALQLYD